MHGRTVGALSAILFILLTGFLCLFFVARKNEVEAGDMAQSRSPEPENSVVLQEISSPSFNRSADTSFNVCSYDIRQGFASKSSTESFSCSAVERPNGLPEWLSGYLVGTGPALYDLGGTSNKYWFNGLAQLYSIDIGATQCVFRSAFLKSNFFNNTLKAGKFEQGFSSAPTNSSWFSKLAQACTTKEPYDNGNLAVSIIGSTCVAHTETPALISFDPVTLKTLGPLTFNDSLAGHLSPAHYCYDPHEDAWYSFLLEFNKTSVYHIFKLPNKAPFVRQELNALTVKEPSYMRTMGLTREHIILVEVPFVVNPFDLLFSTGCFIDQVIWKPELKTKITLLSKKNGAVVATYTMPPFYTFEIINAFDDGAKVVFDLIKYPDVRIIKHTALSVLRAHNYPPFPAGTLTRIMLDTKTGDVHETARTASYGFCAFNRAQKTMAEYRYVYGLSSTVPHYFPNELLKIDQKTCDMLRWSVDGCFPSAPIFVQAPVSTPLSELRRTSLPEDDGVLLSVVFDSRAHRSFILILSATDFKELARIELPVIVPLGFAGIFLRKK